MSLSPHPSRQSARSIRSSLLRSDVKRHTYTGKRTIQRSMISSPQGDVKHTGHVGLDGAYFGDLSFLDTAGCVSIKFISQSLCGISIPIEDVKHAGHVSTLEFIYIVKDLRLSTISPNGKYIHIILSGYSWKCKYYYQPIAMLHFYPQMCRFKNPA